MGSRLPILGLHCHTMKNKNANHSIHKSRIREMKDKYTKHLAKNQVCAIFQM